MKTQFKAGDKVKCIDIIGLGQYRKRLVLEKEYIVRDIRDSGDILLLDGVFNDDELGYDSSRFELIDKNMNKKPDAVWVYVKDNIVSEFIQKLLFANGFKWNGGRQEVLTNTQDYNYLLLSFNAQWGERIICWDRKSGPISYKFDIYDAVKDLPKIMELIETPSMPLPVVNGYTMDEYKKDRLTVKFGCAEISVGFLRDVLRIMNSSYEGNRKLEKITLDSGVILSKTDVENIFKYIEFVNKK